MNHVEWVISKQIERTENNTMPVQELTHNYSRRNLFICRGFKQLTVIRLILRWVDRWVDKFLKKE